MTKLRLTSSQWTGFCRVLLRFLRSTSIRNERTVQLTISRHCRNKKSLDSLCSGLRETMESGTDGLANGGD
jgi:hypothetical protein